MDTDYTWHPRLLQEGVQTYVQYLCCQWEPENFEIISYVQSTVLM